MDGNEQGFWVAIGMCLATVVYAFLTLVVHF